MATALAIVAACACVLGGWWLEHNHHRRRRAERTSVYAACADLLTNTTYGGKSAYPVLTGQFEGHDIRLELIVEALAFRKLPALWLKIDVRSPLPVPGILDYLVRPQNTEFWSPIGRLAHDLSIPTGWPTHALLRTDRLECADLCARLAPSITEFKDERMKELLVTPRGVRLVYLADEGRRLQYGVLRRAQFDQLPLARALVERLLHSACELHRVCADPAISVAA